MSDSKKNKNTNVPKFKLNFYWVYGAIFVLIIGFQFLNSGNLSSRNISKNKFSEILKSNDISRIIIVNRSVAQIYLTKEALRKDIYKKQS